MNWWDNLGLRGRFFYGGVLGILVNVVLVVFGKVWLPVLLGVSVLSLLASLVIRGDDSSQM